MEKQEKSRYQSWKNKEESWYQNRKNKKLRNRGSMGKLFYFMGKSSSGKDTICEEMLSRAELDLRPFIMYTTRPIRANETEGVQYYFVTEEQLRTMQEQGKVIELRTYQTVFGPWHYFTADGENVDMEQYNYLALGTLESYEKVKHYYGSDRVVPIYIEVDDDKRLERAIKRERKQEAPNFEEVCRRFLADQKDFSEENIEKAGIERRFKNNADREICMDEVAEYIRQRIQCG